MENSKNKNNGAVGLVVGACATIAGVKWLFKKGRKLNQKEAERFGRLAGFDIGFRGAETLSEAIRVCSDCNCKIINMEDINDGYKKITVLDDDTMSVDYYIVKSED